MKNTSDSRHKHRQAGLKASATKGKEEEIRAAAMRAWTIEHGKNDAANPYSRQNYAGSPEWIARFRSAGALDPVKRRFLRPLRGLSEHRAERVRHHASAYLQSHRAIAASVEGRYPYTATVHPRDPRTHGSVTSIVQRGVISIWRLHKCRRKIEMTPGVQSRDDTPGGSDEVEPRI